MNEVVRPLATRNIFDEERDLHVSAIRKASFGGFESLSGLGRDSSLGLGNLFDSNFVVDIEPNRMSYSQQGNRAQQTADTEQKQQQQPLVPSGPTASTRTRRENSLYFPFFDLNDPICNSTFASGRHSRRSSSSFLSPNVAPIPHLMQNYQTQHGSAAYILPHGRRDHQHNSSGQHHHFHHLDQSPDQQSWDEYGTFPFIQDEEQGAHLHHQQPSYPDDSARPTLIESHSLPPSHQPHRREQRGPYPVEWEEASNRAHENDRNEENIPARSQPGPQRTATTAAASAAAASLQAGEGFNFWGNPYGIDLFAAHPIVASQNFQQHMARSDLAFQKTNTTDLSQVKLDQQQAMKRSVLHHTLKLSQKRQIGRDSSSEGSSGSKRKKMSNHLLGKPQPLRMEGINPDFQTSPSGQSISAGSSGSKRIAVRWMTPGHIKLLDHVFDTLANNERNVRWWKQCAVTWNETNSHINYLTNDDMKMKVKQMTKERQNRHQAKWWKEARVSKTFEELRTKLEQSLDPEEKWPVEEMAQFVWSRNRTTNTKGGKPMKKAQGRGYCTLLTWDRPVRTLVIEKLLEMHKEHGMKFARIHKSLSKIFPLFDIELAILSSCNCEGCAKWGIGQIENVGQATLEFTRQKCKLLGDVLREQQRLNITDPHILFTEISKSSSCPKLDGWDADEFLELMEPILSGIEAGPAPMVQQRHGSSSGLSPQPQTLDK